VGGYGVPLFFSASITLEWYFSRFSVRYFRLIFDRSDFAMVNWCGPQDLPYTPSLSLSLSRALSLTLAFVVW
jgi:hypothetical protein